MVDLVSRVNAVFRRDALPQVFASLACATIESGKGAVEIVNAGHPPPLVIRRESVEQMVERAVSGFGQLDILCCIAGVVSNHAFMDLPQADWNKIIEVNLTGVYLCGQAAAKQMVKQGKGGKIVNMASTNGLVGEA